jgi:tRNA (guanine37-N1)-methyltransferase
MRFHVLTIFPRMFEVPLGEGILQRARSRDMVGLYVHDLRDYTHDSRRTVDDYPYGGGPGMVMKPEPFFEAVESLRRRGELQHNSRVVLMSPQGRRLSQVLVEELALENEVVLICGRYEGVDDRVREHLATDEISIGDYVLGGGELASMVLIEAVSRLLPGVIGCADSAACDSFSNGLLEYPQYTRPPGFRGWRVPEQLLAGNHGEVERWRRRESLRRTRERRPDLLALAALTSEDASFLECLRSGQGQSDLRE